MKRTTSVYARLGNLLSSSRGLVMALIGLMAASGCTISDNDFSRTAASSAVTLRGGKLYAYSFLDLRGGDFGPNMLTELDRQLVAGLSGAGVDARVIRFRDTRVGRYFPISNTAAYVDVNNVIAENAGVERSFGAAYRLVIFPMRMNQDAAWREYQISWEVDEATSGKPVWSTVSRGKRLVMWYADEEPQGRAKVIVDGALAEMRRSGLL